MERISDIQKATEPVFEVDMKKWAVRANIPSAKKPASKLHLENHFGIPLAERMMHFLSKELPLEGISFHVVPTQFGGENTLLADFSDLAPVFLLVRCVDEDCFDTEIVSDKDEMLLSLTGQNLRQLMDTVKEMHQAGMKVSQKAQVNEGKTSEESFFKSKYEALKRVYNETQPFK